MARSVQTIKDQIKDAKNTQVPLADIKFKEEGGSAVGIANLWAYITAVCINVLEQLWDLMKFNIESSIAKAGAGTAPWLRERILEFQKGDNVIYSNGKVIYETVDETKRILTRCSVTQDGNRVVKAKVAKSDPPAALSGPEIAELEYYIDKIQFAGTQVNVVSLDADRLYVVAEVRYDGQYSESIHADVVAALDAYCAALSSIDNFNGIVYVNKVQDAIQAVNGVVWVKMQEVAYRPNATGWASRTKIFELATGIDQGKAETVSGYIIGETDPSHTFADTLTFTLA